MIGSKNLKPQDLDKVEDALLAEELRKAKEELFNLRFQSATGQLDNHGRLKAVKLRERELGIRAVPVATEAKTTKKKADAKSAKEA
jgi:large subunit ribosomal protein L29